MLHDHSQLNSCGQSDPGFQVIEVRSGLQATVEISRYIAIRREVMGTHEVRNLAGAKALSIAPYSIHSTNVLC